VARPIRYKRYTLALSGFAHAPHIAASEARSANVSAPEHKVRYLGAD